MSDYTATRNVVPDNAKTIQAQVRAGEFGRAYTDRNTLDVEELNVPWYGNYGITRREMNRIFLEDIPKDSSFLEVVCNVGNQLLQLQELGYIAPEDLPQAIEEIHRCAKPTFGNRNITRTGSSS